jgi:hypothetical protein
MKRKPIVNKTDRFILLFLVIGVWGISGTVWFHSNTVDAGIVCNANHSLGKKHEHSTNDISKFKWKVRRIVEDCSVTEGEISC